MKFKQINVILENVNQSWEYNSVWMIGKHKVRVEIRRNAYDNQSHRTIYLFDGQKWNYLWHLPFATAHCKHISYVIKNIDSLAFMQDENELLLEAEKILK